MTTRANISKTGMMLGDTLTSRQYDWLLDLTDDRLRVGFFLNGYPEVLLNTDVLDGNVDFYPAIRGKILGGAHASFSTARQSAHHAYENLHGFHLREGALLLQEEEERLLGIVDARRSADHPIAMCSIDLITADSQAVIEAHREKLTPTFTIGNSPSLS